MLKNFGVFIFYDSFNLIEKEAIILTFSDTNWKLIFTPHIANNFSFDTFPLLIKS